MKKMLISMLAMAAMVSCSSESDPIDEVNPVDAKVPVELRSSIFGIETKGINAGGDGFESDTEIGITMYKGDDKPSNTALGTPSNSNVNFIVGNAGALSEKAAEKTMFWERGKKHYFYAYYPITTTTTGDYIYTAASSVNSKAEQITVKVPANGNSTDLLMAKLETGIEFSTAAITSGNTLSFSHMLSKIKFIIKKETSFTGTGKISEISFKLDKAETSFDIVSQESTVTAGDVTITGSSLDITPDIDGAECNWEPIVIPTSTISELKLTVDGTPLTVSALSAINLVKGNITTITITLKGKGITDLNSGVNAWSSNESGTGDII